MLSEGQGHRSGSTATAESEQWEVLQILAERSSATGGNEVLVVWKAEWIPVDNLRKSGPVYKAWRHTPKWTSSAMTMQVKLPITPGSQLQKDCAYIEVARAAEARRRDSAAAHAAIQHNSMPTEPTGPRKQLGGRPRSLPDPEVPRAVHAKRSSGSSCDDE